MWFFPLLIAWPGYRIDMLCRNGTSGQRVPKYDSVSLTIERLGNALIRF